MRLSLLCLAASFALPSAGAAQTEILDADRDNTLFAEDGSLSNGAGDFFFVGTTDAGDPRRALLRFDVVGSAIPTGSTITGVTLSLYMSRGKSNTGYDISLHRATASWGEGSSHAAGEEGAGTAATTGDATWSHRFYATDPWTAPGGDFVSTASATTVVDRDGRRFSWTSAQMVADVQAWLDGSAANHGWLVMGNETTTRTAKRFDSRQSGTAANRPVTGRAGCPTRSATTATPPTATDAARRAASKGRPAWTARCRWRTPGPHRTADRASTAARPKRTEAAGAARPAPVTRARGRCWRCSPGRSSGDAPSGGGERERSDAREQRTLRRDSRGGRRRLGPASSS